MIARFWISLLVILLWACSDASVSDISDDSVPLTPYPLPPALVAEAERAAARGDSWGDMELAFHYSHEGDENKSAMHFDRCLKARNPECLVEKAGYLMNDAMDREVSLTDRARLLSDALRYNSQALTSNVPRTGDQQKGYLAQREVIFELLQGKTWSDISR
jgi:hypothetical protein